MTSFFLSLMVGLLATSVGFAAGKDSRFDVSADGARVVLELREVSRREVLDRLFAAPDIKLQWSDQSVADEPVSGNFRGTRADVVRQLLARLDFIVVYDQAQGEARITRVIVLRQRSGRSPVKGATAGAQVPRSDKPLVVSQAQSPGTAETRARPQPVPEFKPGSPAPFPAWSPADAAGPQPVPAPTNAGGPLPVPVPSAGTGAMPVPGAPAANGAGK